MVKATLRKTSTAAEPVKNFVDEQAADKKIAELDGSAGVEQLYEGPKDGVVDVESTVVAAPANTVSPVTGSVGADVVPANTTSAVARHSSVTAVYSDVSDGAIEGDFNTEDVRFPQLKIVQGSGTLSQMYPQGSLIYGEEILFPPQVNMQAAAPVLQFVPVMLKKQYRENLSQEDAADGMMPRIANSLEEVESHGGTTRWIGNEKPSWSPSARCMFLLQQPAEGQEGSDAAGFQTELGSALYAPAMYYCAGTAYGYVAKTLLSTATTSLLVPALTPDGVPVVGPDGRPRKKVCLFKHFWSLCVKKVKAGKYTIYVPFIRLLKEETPAEVREYCAGMVRSAGASAASGE
jgi:hypothetical protein